MGRTIILYIALLINLVIMIYTIIEINKETEFKKIRKNVLLYITIIIPVLGLILTKYEKKHNIVRNKI